MDEEFWEIERDVDSFYQFTLHALIHKFHLCNHNPQATHTGRAHQIMRDMYLFKEIIDLYCDNHEKRINHFLSRHYETALKVEK